jgi:hypothetical protein
MATELNGVKMSTNCPHCGNPVELTKTEAEELPLQVGDLVVCKTVEELMNHYRRANQEAVRQKFGEWPRSIITTDCGRLVGFAGIEGCYDTIRFKRWRP